MGMEWPKTARKDDVDYVMDELKIRYLADGPDFLYPSSYHEDLTTEEQKMVLVLFEEFKRTI